MNIRNIQSPMFGTYCYIIWNDAECSIVDCGESAQKIVKEVQILGKPLTKIVITHGHFDHILAAQAIKDATDARIYVSEEDSEMLCDASKSLAVRYNISQDKIVADEYLENTIDICGEKFEVLKTPGHSDGSICLLSGKTLFSGDTLFKGTVGNFLPQNRDKMKASIEKLFKLDDDTKVYPGHNEITTIGEERRSNPFADLSYWEWE